MNEPALWALCRMVAYTYISATQPPFSISLYHVSYNYYQLQKAVVVAVHRRPRASSIAGRINTAHQKQPIPTWTTLSSQNYPLHEFTHHGARLLPTKRIYFRRQLTEEWRRPNARNSRRNLVTRRRQCLWTNPLRGRSRCRGATWIVR